jgi:hypothetical protein
MGGQPNPYIREVHTGRLTKDQLLVVYNHLADIPLDSFFNFSTAVRRVDRQLRTRDLCLTMQATPTSTKLAYNIHLSPRSSLPVYTDPVPQLNNVYQPRWSDDLRITLVVRVNPKTRGTPSAARYDLLRDQMTVGEYLDECVRQGHCTNTRRGRWRGDIIWAVERRYIRLHRPDGTEIALPGPKNALG